MKKKKKSEVREKAEKKSANSSPAPRARKRAVVRKKC
jgi:hypothetical protein